MILPLKKNVYQGAYYWNRNIAVKQHRLIYLLNPKCGTTTIKTCLANLIYTDKELEKFRNDFQDSAQFIHQIPFPHVHLENIRKYRWNTFSFVRNPWDRLVSCYHSKVLTKPISDDHYENGVAKIFKAYPQLVHGMTFADFAREIVLIPDTQAEPHFMSQFKILSDSKGKLIPSTIGRFENFETELDGIFNQYKIPKMNIPLLNKTQRKSYREYYTEELQRAVYKRYQQDIQTFSYTF